MVEGVAVVHVGNDVRGAGGIASVIRAHLDRPAIEARALTSYRQEAKTRWRQNRPALRALLSVQRLHRDVVVHVHLSNRGSLFREGAVAAAARLTRHKVVLTLHGSGLRTSGPMTRVVLKALGVIAHAIHLLSPVYLGVTIRSKEIVIPNDVPVEARAERGRRRPNILFVGEVGMRKGIDILMSLSEMVPEGYCLEIVGPKDPDLEFDFEAFARGRSDVQVIGKVTPADARDRIASAAVLINPSRAEAFPMVVCEALAAGTPVIGTDVGGQGILLGNSGQAIAELAAAAFAKEIVELMDAETWEVRSRSGHGYARSHLDSSLITAKWHDLYVALRDASRVER